MEKKNWGSTKIDIQTFVPQEYVAACFEYEAELNCDFGSFHKENTASNHRGTGCWPTSGTFAGHHGAPCADSYVRVVVQNGVATYSGYESRQSSTTHTFNPLTNVYIPNIETLQLNSIIEGATWGSYDEDNHTGVNHKGNGRVTSWKMTWTGHPNHS